MYVWQPYFLAWPGGRPQGSAGVAGSTEPDDRRTESGDRARSGEVSGGPTRDDPSRSGSADGTGVRADHRESGSVSVWQADRELSGTGAAGRLERESATTGPYHETRELSITFPAGGRCASDGAQPSTEKKIAAIPEDNRYLTRVLDSLDSAFADFDTETAKLDLPHMRNRKPEAIKRYLEFRQYWSGSA